MTGSAKAHKNGAVGQVLQNLSWVKQEGPCMGGGGGFELAQRLQRGATSQRDRQQSPGRADRPVSGIRPALTATAWKRSAAWSKDGEQFSDRQTPIAAG